MPIGRAFGQINIQDINLELGRSPEAVFALGDIVNVHGVNDGGVPYPSTVLDTIRMSGINVDSGFHGYTHAVAQFDGTNDYIASTSALPSELQFRYTTPFSFSFWIYNAGGSNPIAAPYQPQLLYMGTTTFGVRTFQLFYEGKLTNGTYSNKIIARLVRSAFATGRRDYRWDLNSNGIITNGNGWNAANNPGWHHLVLTYSGAGTSTGAFELYWNGNLLTVNQTNNVTDSSDTWTYDNTERLYIGAAGFNTASVNAWRFSGVCFFNYKLSSFDVSRLYNAGAGSGCNSVTNDCHWWGLSVDYNDRSASYTKSASQWANYNLSGVNGPTFNYSIRPSK